MVKELKTEIKKQEVINETENYIAEPHIPYFAGDEFPVWDSGTGRKLVLRPCQTCGKPFYGAKHHRYCPACGAERKNNRPPLTKTCKDCGIQFTGYYNEGRCPKCVEAAEQERYRRYWDKGGTLRPMGSIDKCVLCGKEYIVRSSTQRYCYEECRLKGSIPKYKETQKNKYQNQREEFRKRKTKITKLCVYCMQPFKNSLATNVCSDYCRSEHRELLRNRLCMERGMKNDYMGLWEKREMYREEMKAGEAVEKE